MTEKSKISLRPSGFPWPPVLLLCGILGGWLMGRAVPLPAGPSVPAVGMALILFAIGIDIWVFLLFRKRGTNIRPDRPAEAMVTDGPFRWSRNPIYLGNALILVGFFLAAGNWWYLLAAGLFIWLVTVFAIKPEEAHLQARFGEAFTRYTRTTRRWI